jgi:phytanoyl-CoA hydroxylase
MTAGRDLSERGYAVLKGIIPPALTRGLLEECAAVIDEKAVELERKGVITNLHREFDVHQRAAAIARECPAIIDPLRGGRYAGPGLFALLGCPSLLDALEGVLGPELTCLGLYRLRPKLPSLPGAPGGALPWHQDANAYQAASDGTDVITVWIALVDVTVEMGPLEVLPGSHRAGLHRHYWVERLRLTAIHPDEFPDGEPVALPVSAGDVILFTSLTCHRTAPNLSDQIRWSLDARYHRPAPVEVWPGEGGFLARSAARPAAVLRSAEDFAQLRRSASFDARVQQRPWRTEAEETFCRPRW